MARLELWFPAKPYTITQAWGIRNDSYLRFGYSRHNGIDFLPGKDKRLYCPVQNLEVYDVGYNDATGWRIKGNTKDFYDFSDGRYRVNMVFMHLEAKSSVLEGQILSVGEFMGIPDNTGFSTGAHTHWLCRRIDDRGNLVDKNDADNSFDQSPYLNGFYATDAAQVFGLMRSLISAYTALLEKLKGRS